MTLPIDTAVNWWQLFLHFLTMSLLAVGGAITTASDMHRFLVSGKGWLTDSQFTASIALSQAAPGPNILFVALIGWHIGVNAAGSDASLVHLWGMGLMAALLCMLAILLPSSTLTYMATRWAHRNRERRVVKAFKQGMAPVVVALLVATGWVLSSAHPNPSTDWRLWVVTAICTVAVWKTRIHMLWLLGAGALLGGLGWV